jgi:hypothetical protein
LPTGLNINYKEAIKKFFENEYSPKNEIQVTDINLVYDVAEIESIKK